MANLFVKIIRREIPADIVYEDEQCLAFRDISPQAPVHILLIPKKEIASLQAAESGDQSLLGHLLLKAAQIAREQNLNDGWRAVINTGAKGGQTVFHLHVHILGGRDMGWPPG